MTDSTSTQVRPRRPSVSLWGVGSRGGFLRYGIRNLECVRSELRGNGELKETSP